MAIYIPTPVIVAAIGCAPFVIGWIASRLWPSGGGMFDFSGLFVLGAFAVSAGICWTGLIVWAVMR